MKTTGRPAMPVELDHLIVPARDRVAAARLVATILGVPWAEQGAVGPFSPVYVNASLTLDFDEWSTPVPKQHYCFRVDAESFEAILGRLTSAGIAYRSTPGGPTDHRVNPAFGGSLAYWSEPDGHVWEALTVSYARRPDPSPERSFVGVVRTGHKEDAVEVPFDPAAHWGRKAERFAPGRRGVAVCARIARVAFASHVVARSGKHWLLLPPDVAEACGVQPGAEVEVSLGVPDAATGGAEPVARVSAAD